MHDSSETRHGRSCVRLLTVHQLTEFFSFSWISCLLISPMRKWQLHSSYFCGMKATIIIMWMLWKHTVVDRCICKHQHDMRDFLYENGKKPIGIQYELFVKTRKIIQTASPWSLKWDRNRFPKMGIHVLFSWRKVVTFERSTRLTDRRVISDICKNYF